MKLRGYLLTSLPPLTVTYDKKTNEYKIKLIKSVTFEFELMTKGKTFSEQLNNKISTGKSLRVAALEVIESQRHPTLKLKLSSEEIERIAKAAAQAFEDEHGIHVSVTKFTGTPS